jgi:hypothetical protein
MFKTNPFTFKWRTVNIRPAGGTYTNSNYTDANFSTIPVSPPAWPPRDVWNNVWYNATADYQANTFYDIYQYNSGNVFLVNNVYDTLVYAPPYNYRTDEYACCWCECGGGYGIYAYAPWGEASVWSNGFVNEGTWGNWGECRTCRNRYISIRYYDRYTQYRNYNVYTRYNYIDHNQPLSNMSIYKDYFTAYAVTSQRRVD